MSQGNNEFRVGRPATAGDIEAERRQALSHGRRSAVVTIRTDGQCDSRSHDGSPIQSGGLLALKLRFL